MSRRIRIGTRGSQLALWQANEAARLLTVAGYEPEIVRITTTGDRRQDVSLAEVGGKGLFIKEIEEALDRNAIDIAVHSLKDIPSILPERYVLGAFLERADPRDAWFHPAGIPIGQLPPGATIGTSAPRRRAQLMSRHPQLLIEPIRGNVNTRIDKARGGDFDGIVLAAAGLTRLGRTGEITSFFNVDEMVPAAGQGIIAIETRAGDRVALEAAAAVSHAPSALAAGIERGVLQRFGTQLDCYSAVAVHATSDADGITVRSFFSDYEATRSITATHRDRDPGRVITAVYDELVARGAMELLLARR